MKINKASILGLASLLLFSSGAALPQDRNGPLTWEQCVAIAAKKNPDLASSSRSVEAGKDAYKGSFNGLMPSLSLSNGYSDSNSLGAGGYRWQGQASASLDLFNAGSFADIQSAAAGLTLAQASLRQASNTLRFNLRDAFLRLLFSQQVIEVARIIRDRRQNNAQLVALRYDSGRESKGNMLRSKAQLVQAEVSLTQAIRNLRAAQKSLDRHLGLDDFTVVIVTGTLETDTPPPLPADLRSLLAPRPDVAAQDARIQSAKASLGQSQNSLWPTLSTNYSRSVLGRTEFPNSRYSWSFGTSLSLPLFAGGPTSTYYAVSAAKKNLEKAEQDLRSVRNQAISDLETSWSVFANEVDQVAVQQALLEAARQRNEEADVRYASGLLSYDNWEIIATDRINTERQIVQAKLSAASAEASWLKSLGVGLERGE